MSILQSSRMILDSFKEFCLLARPSRQVDKWLAWLPRNEKHWCTPPQQSPNEQQPILKSSQCPGSRLFSTQAMFNRQYMGHFCFKRRECRVERCKRWQNKRGKSHAAEVFRQILIHFVMSTWYSMLPSLLSHRSLSRVWRIVLVAMIMRQNPQHLQWCF